jgi:ABC transporter DrrB family efflux protein
MTAALGQTLREALLLAGRSLRQIPRVPEKLADATVQPIIFVVLFVYVFGSAIALQGGGSYKEYLISGMFATTPAGTIGGLAVNVAGDVHSGFIDRMRALPVSRVSVLGGLTLADLAERVLGFATLGAMGLIIGWAPHGTVWETLAAFGILLLWAFASCWLGVLIGMLVRDAETAQTVAFTSVFPLMFLSTVFVPADGLPTPLKQIAQWNPMSASAGAVRKLFHNPSPTSPDVWPLQHPIEASLIWCVVLVGVFAPLAVRRYRRLSER